MTELIFLFYAKTVHEDKETPKMYAVFFKSADLVNAIKLEGQKTITAKRYIENG